MATVPAAEYPNISYNVKSDEHAAYEPGPVQEKFGPPLTSCHT